MPDLPDFYMWTETTLAKVTSIDHGLDASKSATPVAGDVYLATDTFYLYACFTAGTWESVAKLYLLLTGGTMSGAIAMGANKITGLADPTAAQDAATKAYTDLFTLLTTFNAHKTRHQDLGADEISVTALSGLLADDQHVLDAEVLAVAAALVHASRHQDLGADEILVTGLSGLLADDQHVLDAEVLAVAAALVHAARHQAAGADVISIAGLAGEPTELTTHKGLTTGVHGVGADYLAKAAASQYFAVNRAGDIGLAETFKRAGEDATLSLFGGQTYPSLLQMSGKDHATAPGQFGFAVPNAAKSGYKIPLKITGATDTPEIYPNDDNLINLGTAAKRWKLVRGVTGTFGDVKLENGWGFTEHPEHGIAVRAPSGKLYKMNLEEIK